jgi:hypothetical protein
MEEILADPAAVYNSPRDVLDDRNLSEDEKNEILRTWEEDAKALLRAESENMAAAEKLPLASDLLKEISNVRLKLDKLRKKKDVS